VLSRPDDPTTFQPNVVSELQLLAPVNVSILFVGFLLGGILKGATGATA